MNALRSATLCTALLLLTGCAGLPGMRQDPARAQAPAPVPPPPTQKDYEKAFTELNKMFQREYERILEERGSRMVQTSRGVSFDALQSGLTRLGMIVENRDADLGIITVAAPAPKPLSGDEWQKTLLADLPAMGGVLCPILGEACRKVRFEPDDYVIVINGTVREVASGSEVSLTTRMREIVPRPGLPRRDYPPPTAVRAALDKIWAAFDQALAAQKIKNAGN